MMYGAMQNTPPPPPKIFKILFNWSEFMDCIEYIHSLKKPFMNDEKGIQIIFEIESFWLL